MVSKHSYKGIHKFSRFFLYIFAIVFFVLGLLILVVSINSSMNSESVSISDSIKAFLVLSVFLPLINIYVGFLEVDIDVDESGANLKSVLKTFHVDWDDIVEVRPASLFGIPMFNKPNIVITKGKLSPFHYLYGLVYARVLQPSFYFSAHISDSDKLRRAIVDGIKKSRISKQQKVKAPTDVS
jgi:hypothetical protein